MKKRMTKKARIQLGAAVVLLLLFALFTVLVCIVDVKDIGPQGSEVGVARLNGFVHRLIGVHMTLYTVTDLLGVIPFGFVAGFALLGLVQWIKRRSLLKVDRSILILGIFYLAVLAFYLLFEVVVINYRPLLIEGILEASYPSSTTMLTLCVMPTAAMQLRGRINRRWLRWALAIPAIGYTLFMVIGRLCSGVHWFSDIIGGSLLSAGLVMLYSGTVNALTGDPEQKND